MGPVETTHRDSFVVRIWHEPGEPGWKGWVQHTRSGESALFREFAELEAFFESCIVENAVVARHGLK